MSVPPSGRFRVPFGADSLRWQTALVLNVPSACVTYLRTRSKKPPEKSYDLFDLTFPSISLCHSCIIIPWPKVRARQALALRCPWRLALPATESCWGSPCVKSLHLLLMMLYTAFSRASLDILPQNRFELENIPLPPFLFLFPFLLLFFFLLLLRLELHSSFKDKFYQHTPCQMLEAGLKGWCPWGHLF